MIFHLVRNADGVRETIMSEYDAEYLRHVAGNLRAMTTTGSRVFYTVEIDF